jgi:hypothetical protein
MAAPLTHTETVDSHAWIRRSGTFQYRVARPVKGFVEERTGVCLSDLELSGGIPGLLRVEVCG